jgi:hypothetical protein
MLKPLKLQKSKTLYHISSPTSPLWTETWTTEAKNKPTITVPENEFNFGLQKIKDKT